MSFFSQQQAQSSDGGGKSPISTKPGMPQMAEVTQEEAMQLALQEVDGG
jgi:hypothetical protein